jgi:hypothetical protein
VVVALLLVMLAVPGVLAEWVELALLVLMLLQLADMDLIIITTTLVDLVVLLVAEILIYMAVVVLDTLTQAATEQWQLAAKVTLVAVLDFSEKQTMPKPEMAHRVQVDQVQEQMMDHWEVLVKLVP